MNEEKGKNMRMPDKLSGAIENASKVLSPVFLSFVLALTMAGCNGGGGGTGSGSGQEGATFGQQATEGLLNPHAPVGK